MKDQVRIRACSGLEGAVPIAPADLGGVPGYRTLQASLGRKGYVLLVEPKESSSHCIYCDGSKIYPGLVKNGLVHCTFAHVPIDGKPCKVIVHRQRYICANCGRAHSDPLPSCHPHLRMSLGLVAFINDRPKQCMMDLAKEVGVSARTVKKVLAETVYGVRQRRDGRLPKILGIDEKYLSGKYYCVLTDLEHGLHFRILSNNSDSTIRATLREYRNREDVIAVAMDMTGRYRAIVYEMLPNAGVVIDLFHVVDAARDCREQVRIYAFKHVGEQIKKELRGRENFWKVFDSPAFLGVQADLFGSDIPSLKVANDTYRSFAGIFKHAQNELQCASLYDEWVHEMDESMRPYFAPLMDKIENHRDEIFSYCSLGLTNGFTEAHNRVIANLHRQMPHASIETLDSILTARADLKHCKSIIRASDSSTTPPPAAQGTGPDLSIAASIKRSMQMALRRQSAGRKASDSQDTACPSVEVHSNSYDSCD